MKKKTILAALLCSVILTACGNKNPEATATDEGTTVAVTEDVNEASDSQEAIPDEEVLVTKESEEPEDDLYYKFNPHAYPKKLRDAYGDDEMKAFLNLVDALRAGEDTFECSSREVYEWCFSGGPLDDLFPVARFTISGDFLDGYSDGVGHFTYDIPKGTYGTYRTFNDKTGICDDLSAVYSYLLLQCDVESMKYEGHVGEGHAWSYVTLDGVGYFIDPTWGLNENGDPDLTFFMMTEADRELDFGDRMDPIMYYYDHENTNVDFSATDDRYAELHGGEFVSLDRDNKILYYSVEGEEREFHYDA